MAIALPVDAFVANVDVKFVMFDCGTLSIPTVAIFVTRPAVSTVIETFVLATALYVPARIPVFASLNDEIVYGAIIASVTALLPNVATVYFSPRYIRNTDALASITSVNTICVPPDCSP